MVQIMVRLGFCSCLFSLCLFDITKQRSTTSNLEQLNEMFCGNRIEISDCGVFLVGFLKKKELSSKGPFIFYEGGGGLVGFGKHHLKIA